MPGSQGINPKFFGGQHFSEKAVIESRMDTELPETHCPQTKTDGDKDP